MRKPMTNEKQKVVMPLNARELLGQMQSRNEYKRRSAALEIGKLPESDADIVRVLLSAMRSDSDPVVRKAAAEALLSAPQQAVLWHFPELMASYEQIKQLGPRAYDQANQIQIPSICCRCGNRPGTATLKLTSVESHAYHLIFVTFFEQTTRSLTVSVCDPCKKTLRKTRFRNASATVGSISGGLLLGATAGFLWPWLSNGQIPSDWFIWVIGGIIAGMFAGLGLALVLHDPTGLALGTLDNGRFWFFNSEFQNQFRELNPLHTANNPTRRRSTFLSWR